VCILPVARTRQARTKRPVIDDTW